MYEDVLYSLVLVPYGMLSCAVFAFFVWITPYVANSLGDFIITILRTIRKVLVRMFHPQNNEWVERILLAIEETREWGHPPGRHRYGEIPLDVTFGREIRTHRMGV